MDVEGTDASGLIGGLGEVRVQQRSARERERGASTLGRFAQFLEQKGFTTEPAREPYGYEPVVQEFEQWLRRVRDLGEVTVAERRRYVVPFLESIGDPLAEALNGLEADDICTYAVKVAQGRGKSQRRSIFTTLRAFLRFCHCRGYTTRDLSRAVPSVRSYTLADSPRGISEEEGRRALDAVDATTAVGKRDYAILQLLHSYGVRGGQIRALRLEDINWREDTILFGPMKRGKRSLLPLTVAVGESLLDYIQHSRPPAPFSHVFLTSLAPYHPLDNPMVLSSIVRKYMERAGVVGPRRGSHAFRHGFASRKVAEGHSLKLVADVLGHRQIATTFIYTKVDFASLRQVAMPWPEVKR
jgi:site-specific recombinase XerD